MTVTTNGQYVKEIVKEINLLWQDILSHLCEKNKRQSPKKKTEREKLANINKELLK